MNNYKLFRNKRLFLIDTKKQSNKFMNTNNKLHFPEWLDFNGYINPTFMNLSFFKNNIEYKTDELFKEFRKQSMNRHLLVLTAITEFLEEQQISIYEIKGHYGFACLTYMYFDKQYKYEFRYNMETGEVTIL